MPESLAFFETVRISLQNGTDSSVFVKFCYENIKRKALQRELKAVEDAYAGTLGWLELGELRSWVEAEELVYGYIVAEHKLKENL